MSGSSIRFKRGNKADLPQSASSGTPLWCEDTNELYIGTENGISKIGADDTALSNKVSKTGDTMSGTLSVEKADVGAVHIKSSNLNYDYTQTKAPDSNIYAGRILSYDKNNNWCGSFEHCHNTSNIMNSSMIIRRSVDGVAKTGSIAINIDSSGNIYTYAPTPTADDDSTKIATTEFVKSVLNTSGAGMATISMSGNGYCKFTNGLIIQWGKISVTNSTVSVTLPTAFSSTNYRVTSSQAENGNISWDNSNLIITISSTSVFKMRRYDTCRCFWHAIGY